MDKEFEELLQKNFKFTPTKSQSALFKALWPFLEDESPRSIFLLKGYAGTGKTTFLHSFLKTSAKYGWKSLLLAPTGRAAKVMANYTKRKAFTIHRKIYAVSEDTEASRLVFELQKNTDEGYIYIVDEASMIGEQAEFCQNSLLRDLITYVFTSDQNKLFLIGDQAQLPPVGIEVSPALEASYLENHYHATVFTATLTEVMRQEENAGILQNATWLRENLEKETFQINLRTQQYKDIFKMSSERLQDGLQYAYQKFGLEQTVIITRSNKNAVLYNNFIRNQIFYYEAELEIGDFLMVVKNNYNTLPEDSQAGFIANGEFVEVKRVGREEEIHGFRFQHVTLQLLDYPDEPEFDTLIILNTLNSASPNLSSDDQNKLYQSVEKDYFWAKTKKAKRKLIKEDKYLNALQVKFAYALTCHKAQGGQWSAVFIDAMYLPDNKIEKETLRWLYTAITRGVSQVYLINFQPFLFT